MAEVVSAVLVRKVPPSNFRDIEANPDRVSGGSGSHFIEVPSGKLEEVVEFFGGQPAGKTLVPIQVGVVGSPGDAASMEWGRRFDGKTTRLYTPQNRQFRSGSRRHPAWTAAHGFPQAPDDITTKAEAEAVLGGELRIYLVRLADGRYFAGHVRGGDYPASWPEDPKLRRIWEKDGVAEFATAGEGPADAATEAVLRKIFDSWSRGRAVLLYGPPGTGKTHILSQLWRRLQEGAGAEQLLIDLEDAQKPFEIERTAAPIPTPAALEWLTFHQSFSYEEFFLGLRPHPAGEGGTELRPRAGRLLHRLHQVASADEEAQSAVFFIDEINRGNAARIFGELITFLDADYREGGAMPLPVPLPGVGADPGDPGRSEPIDLPDGGEVRLPLPWRMPQHLYVIASMNSVDRAATPLDSALARRFERLELRPDLDVLAAWLGVERADLEEAAAALRGPEASPDAWETLEPETCAILLLDRLNHRIAEDFGEDFELGHALLRPLVEAEDRWATLAQVWDETIWPQLLERYVARPEQLREVLKVGDAPPGLDYAFRPRTELGAQSESLERVAPVRLTELSAERSRAALRFLAR
ncbi:MAG TPA: AAA family ATPase [Solirubrobacterales bacterium]|nr:AAA family ATPase [Solirubrobacterales bacterium]